MVAWGPTLSFPSHPLLSFIVAGRCLEYVSLLFYLFFLRVVGGGLMRGAFLASGSNDGMYVIFVRIL